MNSLTCSLKKALAWTLLYLPVIFGYAYTAALLVIAGLVVIGHASPTLHTLLIAGLWGYGALAVINLYVMTVFGFRHCCIGLNSFWVHVGHSKLKVAADALWSPLWPLGWHGMIRGLLGWDMDWLTISLEPTVYLLSTLRRGHRVDHVDLVSGTTETSYYK